MPFIIKISREKLPQPKVNQTEPNQTSMRVHQTISKSSGGIKLFKILHYYELISLIWGNIARKDGMSEPLRSDDFSTFG